MFTGIVEETGTVRYCRDSEQGFDFAIDCETVLEGTRTGDSIAVNGVCLTVTSMDTHGFVAGLAPETRARTSLDVEKPGARVNLERSVTPTTRMGGHFVQGHVDGTGRITAFDQDADALWVTVEAADALLRYIVPKGYIALDGTSLTVVDVTDTTFNVTLVAYTQTQIVLPTRAIGDRVNIEVDVLGKYVEKLVGSRAVDGSASNRERQP